MVKKDRAGLRMGVGVAIICLNDWKPVKALNVTDRLEFETVWCKISTPNSEYYVTGIYHLPDPAYDPVDLLEYISGTCDQILADDPNANIISAGDINHLNVNEFLRQQAR